jgi:hypothetical protein
LIAGVRPAIWRRFVTASPAVVVMMNGNGLVEVGLYLSKVFTSKSFEISWTFPRGWM